jgi:hypothetical protein
MIESAVVVRRLALPAVLAAFAAAGVAVPSIAAERAPTPPALETEHKSPSGAFVFRTPAGWTVETSVGPETVNAFGSGVRVRFVHRPGEHGYDSLHGACMLERLAPPSETSPVIKYEYDFIGGEIGNDRRALDSAFTIRYDGAVHGHKEWRQRNVTVVGGGHSLCAISYAPASLGKKKETRALLDAVLASVILR